VDEATKIVLVALINTLGSLGTAYLAAHHDRGNSDAALKKEVQDLDGKKSAPGPGSGSSGPGKET
jgi:hypothetical protein